METRRPRKPLFLEAYSTHFLFVQFFVHVYLTNFKDDSNNKSYNKSSRHGSAASDYNGDNNAELRGMEYGTVRLLLRHGHLLLCLLVLPVHAVSNGLSVRMVLPHAPAGRLLHGDFLLSPQFHEGALWHPRLML
ncbi:hypothetical protein AAFF_G00325130 [Aldrovandia affinis]|uniref:Uncharacterized protein n=1 Tax=Aldrovandia affinis TaxID=143900 RepID=A0AAD7T961_9TELE|nr:hypothetical protein AAFF_G00325130 [Aldrovandia affinis]